MAARILQGRKLTIQIQEKNLGSFLFNRCNDYSERICQVDGRRNKTETYESVKLRSVRVALALQKKDVTSQDMIAFCSSNTLDNMIPIIACAFLGAKIVNLEPTLSIRQNAHLIKLVEPKIIFVEENSVALIEESLSFAAINSEIIVFGDSEKYPIFDPLLDSQEQEDSFKPVQVEEDDTAILFFTSGTTGLPKAICHSHKSFLKLIAISYELELGNANLHLSTFYWITASIIMYTGFARGSYRVFCSDATAEDVFRIIETYKTKTIFSAPILTYSLTSFKEGYKYNISSLEVFIIGGTPIATSQLIELVKLFHFCSVCLCYGMTEVGIASYWKINGDKKLDSLKLERCGRPTAEMKIKVVDLNTRQPFGPNQLGEICIWSPCMMTGYYKHDSSSVFDEDGFIKTGDIGYCDDDEFCITVEELKILLNFNRGIFSRLLLKMFYWNMKVSKKQQFLDCMTKRMGVCPLRV